MTQQSYFKIHFLEELLYTYWGSIVAIAFVLMWKYTLLEGCKAEVVVCIHIEILCVFVYSQLCPTLCGPMDCSPKGSTVLGIFQVILEWIDISCPRGSSSREQTWVSCIAGRFLYHLSHQGSPQYITRQKVGAAASNLGLLASTQPPYICQDIMQHHWSHVHFQLLPRASWSTTQRAESRTFTSWTVWMPLGRWPQGWWAG